MATPVTALTPAPPLLRPFSNWSESYRPVSYAVAVKTMWNLALVAVSAVTLILTVTEKPATPLRVWISVFSLGCLLRVLRLQLVWLVYKRRNDTGVSQSSGIAISTLIRSARILEKLNTQISNMLFGTGNIWLGFVGNDAPRLCRVTLAFHAYNYFCTDMHLLFIPRFSFIKKGASKADISNLPKYIFEEADDEEQGRTCRMVPMQTNAPGFSVEHVLLTMDACCCICLCNYDHGAELCLLPCNHHFHAACIRKWLLRRATCPLCRGHIIVRN